MNAEYDERISPWRFGTSGIRAKMQAGYLGFNQVSVAKIAHALGQFLKPNSLVVIGFDARHHSEEYAELVARVLMPSGHKCLVFDKLIPTPICAFSVAELQADLGLIITASHNPAHDNGIKLYGQNGAQLVIPQTTQIESLIAAAPAYSEIIQSTQNLERVPGSVIDAYFKAVIVRCSSDEVNQIVYTPLHGVGGPYVLRALRESGFQNIHVVASQAQPDGDFPTVKSPNPEEAGTLDLALAYMRETKADLVLANDPDADRLAVCVESRMLTGNEVGILLGNYLIENNTLPKALVMSTVVSSRMLSKIAAYHHIAYAETLTGFSNIAKVALEREQNFGETFIFGYEESLGYSVNRRVRDKDGISAAIVFAQLAAGLKAQNKSLLDELDRLYQLHGLYRSLAWSYSISALKQPDLSNLPGLTKQASPAPNLLLYTGEHDLKLMIRPSGTEPKIKFYAEVIGEIQDEKVLDDFLVQLRTRIDLCAI